MLKIVKAGEPIPVNQIVIVIYSPPGLGKTTLAYSSDDPLLLDADKGSYRASGRKDTVAAPTWQAIEAMAPDELAPYKTIILDTAGRTLDLLSTDIIAKDPKCSQGGGSLSLKGFGILKSRFAAYLNMLKARGKDIVLICHMDEQRNGDDVIERLDVQGGSKGEIYKSADAMGRIMIRNGQRLIDFNPRENSFGKNPCGLAVLPFELANKTCLGDIIRTIKERLNQGVPQKAQPATQPAQKPASAPSAASAGLPKASIPDPEIISGSLMSIKPGKTVPKKNGKPSGAAGREFLGLMVGPNKVTCFDNKELAIDTRGNKKRAFDLLLEALNEHVSFRVEKKGQYLNAVGFIRIANLEWDADGTPVLRRDPPASAGAYAPTDDDFPEGMFGQDN